MYKRNSSALLYSPPPQALLFRFCANPSVFMTQPLPKALWKLNGLVVPVVFMWTLASSGLGQLHLNHICLNQARETLLIYICLGAVDSITGQRVSAPLLLCIKFLIEC